MKNIVILGGGFGGITAALRLARSLKGGHSVTLVDRKDRFFMGLGKPWELVGLRPLSQGTRSLKNLKDKSVRFVQADIQKIDTAAKTVLTSAGPLAWDYLVVALGAETAPESVSGLPPSSNFYEASNLPGLHGSLKALKRGKIALVICSSPYKCPPAPYETALLIDSWLQSRGDREQIELAVYLPEPLPLAVAGPAAGKKVKEFVEGRGIPVHTGHKLIRVEEGRRLVFENGVQTNCDVLLAVAPHRVPASLVVSGLAEAGGWVPTDPKTLATSIPNVYAIGDAAGLKLPAGGMLPKAGIFAELEGEIAADAILASLGVGPKPRDFDGAGYCFMEAGNGKAAKVKGDFFGPTTDRVAMEEPSEEGFRLKQQFEAERLAAWFD